jgi:hypothetical protein
MVPAMTREGDIGLHRMPLEIRRLPAHSPRQGDIGLQRLRLKFRPRSADITSVPPGKEALPMSRYRRLMVSLGWLAAFVMAIGTGWKNS